MLELLDRRIFRCRSLIKQLRLKRFALLAAAVCFTFGFSTFALRTSMFPAIGSPAANGHIDSALNVRPKRQCQSWPCPGTGPFPRSRCLWCPRCPMLPHGILHLTSACEQALARERANLSVIVCRENRYESNSSGKL